MPDLSHLRAVLFDMDGVLVDVSGSYHRAILETAHHFLGEPIDPELIQQYKNRGGFNDDWVLTHTLLQDRGFFVAFDEVVRVFQDKYRGETFDGFIAEEPPLVKTETLETLAAHFPLALVTGRPEEDAHWTLERFGWNDFFPTVIAMEHQAGRGKPDPYPLELAFAELLNQAGGLLPEHTAYLGDTIDDMRAATAAGALPIGIVPPYLDFETHGARLREAGAWEVLNSADAFPALLTTADR